MKHLILLLIFLPLFLDAQYIIRFAGNDTCGYSGDGGPAINAMLSSPEGIYTDKAGNMYFAEWGTGHIRKVNPAGIISTIAGNASGIHSGDGGPATAAGLNQPVSVAVDKFGNVYIAEKFSYIRKVDSTGIITTYAGNGMFSYGGDGGQATAASFGMLSGLAVDTSGNVYIAEPMDNRIRIINSAGVITTFAGDGSLWYGGDGGPARFAQLASVMSRMN